MFSQKPVLDPNALTRQAERHFASELEFAEPAPDGWVAVTLRGPAPYVGAFRLRARAAEASDHEGLDAAELANRSYGMADLARRCQHVWEMRIGSGTESAAVYYLAAILASIALGPLLPSDGSGLFGVRSCRERAQRLSNEGD